MSPKKMPGSEIDVIALWIPNLSISASEIRGLHSGKGTPVLSVTPMPASADTYSSGRIWWCASIFPAGAAILHLAVFDDDTGAALGV